MSRAPGARHRNFGSGFDLVIFPVGTQVSASVEPEGLAFRIESGRKQVSAVMPLEVTRRLLEQMRRALVIAEKKAQLQGQVV